MKNQLVSNQRVAGRLYKIYDAKKNIDDFASLWAEAVERSEAGWYQQMAKESNRIGTEDSLLDIDYEVVLHQTLQVAVSVPSDALNTRMCACTTKHKSKPRLRLNVGTPVPQSIAETTL